MYPSKRLLALKDVSLGDEYYVPGEKFYATDVDAEYLITRKKAESIEAEDLPPLPTYAPVFEAPAIEEPKAEEAPTRRRGRRSALVELPQEEVSEVVAEVPAVEAPVAEAAAVDAPEQPADVVQQDEQ